MASVWWIVANYLLPVPAILFLLLAIPGPRWGTFADRIALEAIRAHICHWERLWELPDRAMEEGPCAHDHRVPRNLTPHRTLRRGILLFCSKVFDLQLVGMFKLLHVALFLTMVACLGTCAGCGGVLRRWAGCIGRAAWANQLTGHRSGGS